MDDPRFVYCPPGPGADPSAPAASDIQRREGSNGLFTGQVRKRESYIEEHLTRGQLRELLDEKAAREAGDD